MEAAVITYQLRDHLVNGLELFFGEGVLHHDHFVDLLVDRIGKFPFRGKVYLVLVPKLGDE